MNTSENKSEQDDFEIFFDVGQIEEQIALANENDSTCYSYVKLGKLYAKAQRYDEAIEYYNQAIQMNPTEKGFHYYRGVAYFQMGESMKAMEDFMIALERDPWNKWDILNFTGTIKLRNGDIPGALNDIEQVLHRNKGLLNDLRISMDEYDILMNYKRLNG
ncbi:MAG: tetratricopeptide repeat protein [Flavobacteriales bacterium]|nr:tetratricopeptide repeat protein [Flavobacteriales bacterium]